MLRRIDDLTGAISAAHEAIARSNALGTAMAQLVLARWLTGHAWRTYVAESSSTLELRDKIDAALTADRAGIESECERRIAVRTEIALTRRDDGVSLACSSCSEPAIVLSKAAGDYIGERLGILSRRVTWTGGEAERLSAVLAGGDSRQLIEHLRAEKPAACDAYCDVCNRVYCRHHLAIESTWSGTWHEATYATCAFGHEREIE